MNGPWCLGKSHRSIGQKLLQEKGEVIEDLLNGLEGQRIAMSALPPQKPSQHLEKSCRKKNWERSSKLY